MEIREYEEKDADAVKDLLVELQELIVHLDEDRYNIITSHYRDEVFAFIMMNVHKYEGKIFVAEDNGKLIGLVVTLINNDEEETFDFKAPKRGRISDIVITKAYQHQGIGQKLLAYAENYLASVGCHDVLLECFGYNTNAKEFYRHLGYKQRTETLMKRIEKVKKIERVEYEERNNN